MRGAVLATLLSLAAAATSSSGQSTVELVSIAVAGEARWAAGASTRSDTEDLSYFLEKGLVHSRYQCSETPNHKTTQIDLAATEAIALKAMNEFSVDHAMDGDTQDELPLGVPALESAGVCERTLLLWHTPCAEANSPWNKVGISLVGASVTVEGRFPNAVLDVAIESKPSFTSPLKIPAMNSKDLGMPDNDPAELQLRYDCKGSGVAMIELRLWLQNSGNLPGQDEGHVCLRWAKACTVGFTQFSMEHTKFGRVFDRGVLQRGWGKPTFKEGRFDEETVFDILYYGSSQDAMSLTVSSSNESLLLPNVDITQKDAMYLGNEFIPDYWLNRTERIFFFPTKHRQASITYECEGIGEADITLTLRKYAMEYRSPRERSETGYVGVWTMYDDEFDDFEEVREPLVPVQGVENTVTARWRKVCGGKFARAEVRAIGGPYTRETPGLAVQNNIVRPRFRTPCEPSKVSTLAARVSHCGRDDLLWKLNESENMASLTVLLRSNNYSFAFLDWTVPHLSFDPPGGLFAESTYKGPDYSLEDNDILFSATVELKLVCLRKGLGVVGITIALPGLQSFTIALSKRCLGSKEASASRSSIVPAIAAVSAIVLSLFALASMVRTVSGGTPTESNGSKTGGCVPGQVVGGRGSYAGTRLWEVELVEEGKRRA